MSVVHLYFFQGICGNEANGRTNAHFICNVDCITSVNNVCDIKAQQITNGDHTLRNQPTHSAKADA